ncbi:MAG: hypothetical protein RSE24_07490, partial [Oscillospiraceae bacterium]
AVQQDQSKLMAKRAATTIAKEFAKDGREYGTHWTSPIEKSLFGSGKTTDTVTLNNLQLSGYDGLGYTCDVVIKTAGSAAKFTATATCGEKTSTVSLAAHFTPPGARGEDIFPTFKGNKGGDFESADTFSWLLKPDWQTLPQGITLYELPYSTGLITVGSNDNKDSFYYITQDGGSDWTGGSALQAVGSGNIYIFIDGEGDYTFEGVAPSPLMENTPTVIFVLIGSPVKLHLYGDSYCCVYNTVEDDTNTIDATNLLGSAMSVCEDTGKIMLAGGSYIPPKNTIYAGANSASAAHQLGTWEVIQYEK